MTLVYYFSFNVFLAAGFSGDCAVKSIVILVFEALRLVLFPNGDLTSVLSSILIL